jgi:hypothetical protein
MLMLCCTPRSIAGFLVEALRDQGVGHVVFAGSTGAEDRGVGPCRLIELAEHRSADRRARE